MALRAAALAPSKRTCGTLALGCVGQFGPLAARLLGTAQPRKLRIQERHGLGGSLRRRCRRPRSIPRSGQCDALAGTPVPRMGLSAARSDAAHLLDGLVEQKRDVSHGVSL